MFGGQLAACKVDLDIELRKFVAEKIWELDPHNSALYVLLSNMYAELGKWKKVIGVRTLMRNQGVIKKPWLQLD
ncbi:hypothetical protein AgCh_005256 [Apium graveolens]